VMEEWLRKVEDGVQGFEVEYDQLGLREEIRGFWRGFEEERKKGEREIEALMGEVEGLEREFRGLVDGEGLEVEVEVEMKKEVKRVLERKTKIWEDFYARQDLDVVRNVTEMLKEVSCCILSCGAKVFFRDMLTICRPSSPFE